MPAQKPPQLTAEDARAWFEERLPAAWFSDVQALVDRDEILIIGTLPDADGDADDAAEAIDSFRDDTRDDRIAIAREAEATFDRKVSWGASFAGVRMIFTHLGVPVMTRLRLTERSTLDTLVGAGVARSRSDALGWCVRLVADHEREWLDELTSAIEEVERIRERRS